MSKKVKSSKSTFYTVTSSPNVTQKFANNSTKLSFKQAYEDEDILAYLKAVKSNYSSLDLNEKAEFNEIMVNGKLVLTKYKLEFIPNDDSKLGDGCFTSNYFSYNLHDFSFNQIPICFIYGLYASDDRLKRLALGDLLVLNERKPREIYIKCKNFLTRSFSFCNEENTSYEEFIKFFTILRETILNSTYAIGLDSIESVLTLDAQNDLKYFLSKSDLSQELLAYNCENSFDVVEIPNSNTPPVVLPKNFINQSNLNKTKYFYDGKFPIWSFTHENGPSLILISSSYPNKIRETEEFLASYNKVLCDSISKMTENGYDLYKFRVPLDFIKLSIAYQKLNDICSYKHTLELYADDDDLWFSRLHNTKWFKYITRTLACVNSLIEKLTQSNLNCYLEESGPNKDISCVIASLVKLCLYKKYRCIEGIKHLIQKEWFYVGHRFASRLKIRHKFDDNELFSPVFLFFLDCAHQILKQFPDDFQFNELFLIHMYDYAIIGQSAIFSSNGSSDYLNGNVSINNKLWDHMSWCQNEIFKNQKFNVSKRKFLKMNKILQPNDHPHALEVWSKCYLRWYNLNITFDDYQSIDQVNIETNEGNTEVQPVRTPPSVPTRPSIRIKTTALTPDPYRLSTYAGHLDTIQSREPDREMAHLNFHIRTHVTPDGNIESSV